MKQFIKELITKAKLLDSTRFVSYVSNTLTWVIFPVNPLNLMQEV